MTVSMGGQSVGERPLGVQAAQLLAAANWARQQFPGAPVSLRAVGWNASVAALIAGALADEPFREVTGRDTLGSLKSLIEKKIPYDDYPALFCFGLLRDFDVPELTALCKPARVTFATTDTPPAR